MTRYHWFVFTVAALGWLFDTMDQQLFNLARAPAVNELLHYTAGDPDPGGRVKLYNGLATMIFMIGWATGGIIFGILGDRLGRAKTMVMTILLYSLFTGLSALSYGIWDFIFYRFLTGLGVGGEFAVGVALVAEVMPDRARPHALGLLQGLSAVGNITAAFIAILMGQLKSAGIIGNAWRWMFVIGIVPAVVAVLAMRRLKEPERWKTAAAREDSKRLGSFKELFGDRRWRRNAIVGLLLATSGVIGLWGIGFYVFELIRAVLHDSFVAQKMSPAEIEGAKTFWTGIASVLLNAGAFVGIWAFSRFTATHGRKPAFAIAFVLALVGTSLSFWFLKTLTDIIWMMPLLGFCILSVFGGYAIYFPELFPTRLRSTGTSFCYNVGRYLASPGPLALNILAGSVYGIYGQETSYRLAGITMCSCFLIGLAALPFAPETKGQPLPD